MGEAMKMEEKVPRITPMVMAKAKGWMLLPPSSRMHSNTMRVDTEVLMVRAKVWLMESLKSTW